MAGTPHADVLTIQGAATGTPLQTLRSGATATLSNVAGTASNVTVLASNTSRRAVVIVNDSTAALRLKFGSAASATSFTYLLQPGDTLELTSTIYTGIITGLWDSATGSARVTELTA